MEIGKIGIWSFLDMLPAAEAQEVAREIEDLGFSALWIPEAVGREVFTSSGILLAGTKRLVVATGIANVWARDAMAMANAQRTLCEAYPGRFLLGMGVSHAPMVDTLRGHDYRKPLTYMRNYLDAMDRAVFAGARRCGVLGGCTGSAVSARAAGGTATRSFRVSLSTNLQRHTQ